MVSSCAHAPRLARLLLPMPARLPDQFSSRFCDPPVTRVELIGRVTLPVPATVLVVSAVTGWAASSAGVISLLVSAGTGSRRLTVTVALSVADPPVTVASAAPSVAVVLKPAAARLTPWVMLPGWMKKVGVVLAVSPAPGS